jgi:WXG100 family type VII secretion target
MSDPEATAASRSIRVSTDALLEVAARFRAAGDDTDKMILELEKTVKELKEGWKGADQQVFYQYFEEWRASIVGIPQFLRLAARELDATAQRYHTADSEVAPPSPDGPVLK